MEKAAPETAWDRLFSWRALEFFGEEMRGLQATGNPLELAHLLRPLSDVADMARQCLVALTEWGESDFQSVSDCAHLKPFVSESARSPLYSVALLDVLSQCLHTSDEINAFLEFETDPEGYQQLITGSLSDLMRMLQNLDGLTEERQGAELAAAAMIEAAAAAKRLKWTAKGGKSRKGQRGPFTQAIEALAYSLETRDFDLVLAEIRQDAEDDSELMDDLRARRTQPVTVKFQQVDDSTIYCQFGEKEHERAFKTVKNIILKMPENNG